MKTRYKFERPSYGLVVAAAPLMAVGLIWLNRNARPWWVGVALFGVSVLLLAAFLAVSYRRLYMSRGPWTLRALLHLAAAGLGLVMGGLLIWLAAVDLVTGQLSDVAVAVSRQMRNLGIVFLLLGAIALLSDSR